MPRRSLDVEVRLDLQCFAWYSALGPGEIRRKIDYMLDTLNERIDAGDHVPRKLWPKVPAYRDVDNLWRYEVDREMRAIYTIRRESDRYTVRIIEIFPDHKSYERRFGY